MERVEYLIGLKYDCPDLSRLKTRGERIDAAKASVQPVLEAAKQRFAAYPEIQILDELWLLPSLLAASSKSDFERLYNVQLNLGDRAQPQ